MCNAFSLFYIGPNAGQVVHEYAKIHLALDDMVVRSGGGGGGLIDVLDPARLALMSALSK